MNMFFTNHKKGLIYICMYILLFGSFSFILYGQFLPNSSQTMISKSFEENNPIAIPLVTPENADKANIDALEYYSNLCSSVHIIPTAIPVLTPDEATDNNTKAIKEYKKEMRIKQIHHIMNIFGISQNKLSFLISLIPFLLFFDLLFIKVKWVASIRNRLFPTVQRRFYVFSAVSLLSFGLLVFVPWSVYFGNCSQFSFIFQDFLNETLLLLSLLIIILTTILLIIPPKISDYLVALLAGLGLCIYIQSMFMNRYLGIMDGTEQEWNKHNIWGTINMLIWIAVAFAPLIIRHVYPSSIRIISSCSTLILTLEIIATAFMVYNAPAMVWARNGNYICDDSNQFQLSKERNIIIFIFDALDSNYIEECINADQQVKENLKDFTWYTAAQSCYSSTFPSLHHEVTGATIRPAKDQAELFHNSWSSPSAESFYKQVNDAGYESRCYIKGGSDFGTYDFFHKYYSNIYEEKISYLINYDELRRCLALISGFSAMPYFMKRFFFYGDDFSDNVVQSVIDSDPSKNDVIEYSNETYFKRMKSGGITTDANSQVLAFHYTRGAHAPWAVDEKCRYNESSNYVLAARSCFYLLSELITLLKNNNIYEQTAILVCSDHGYNFATRFSMTFITKSFNSHNDELQKSDIKIQSIDIIPTLLSWASGDNADFSAFDGFPASNIPQDRERKAYLMYSHSRIPPFEAVDGNPMKYNCFREHSYNKENFDWVESFKQFIPLNKDAEVDESILFTYRK